MTALAAEPLLHGSGNLCDRNVSAGAELQLPIVLAILAGCTSELPPELAREVTLIGEAAVQADLGQRFVGVDQRATRNAQPKLAQKSLRGEMESGAEPAFDARSDMFEMDARRWLVIS